jgi:hypothetical protein
VDLYALKSLPGSFSLGVEIPPSGEEYGGLADLFKVHCDPELKVRYSCAIDLFYQTRILILYPYRGTQYEEA